MWVFFSSKTNNSVLLLLKGQVLFMAIDEKSNVVELRNKGYGYKAISSQLNIPLSTVKSILKRETADKCKNCGKPLKQIEGKKAKKFCCDKCRMKWWYDNQHLLNKKASYEVECACCKKKFIFYGYGGRKYCSNACYLRDRYGER